MQKPPANALFYDLNANDSRLRVSVQLPCGDPRPFDALGMEGPKPLGRNAKGAAGRQKGEAARAGVKGDRWFGGEPSRGGGAGEQSLETAFEAREVTRKERGG